MAGFQMPRKQMDLYFLQTIRIWFSFQTDHSHHNQHNNKAISHKQPTPPTSTMMEEGRHDGGKGRANTSSHSHSLRPPLLIFFRVCVCVCVCKKSHVWFVLIQMPAAWFVSAEEDLTPGCYWKKRDGDNVAENRWEFDWEAKIMMRIYVLFWLIRRKTAAARIRTTSDDLFDVILTSVQLPIHVGTYTWISRWQ